MALDEGGMAGSGPATSSWIDEAAFKRLAALSDDDADAYRELPIGVACVRAVG